jgi:predicted  nucleic acid-binding Zn-ribbon protein
MTGRDLTFIFIGLLIAIGLAGLNDFVSKVNTYSKAEEEIIKIGNTYNTMREQIGTNTNIANQAINMVRNYIDKTDSLVRQQDSLQKQISDLQKQIAELKALYNDLDYKYRSQGQATTSVPKYSNY